MRRHLAAALAAALLVPGLAACGSEKDDSGDSGNPTSIEGVSVTGDFNEEPEVKTDEGFDVSKTETATVIEGDGPEVKANDAALINLYLLNGTNNKQAYSSFDSGQAQEVTLTPEALPGGLDKALIGQRRGARVVMAAPVSEAIGKDGAEQVGLAAEDDAVFVVDLVSVHPTDALDGPEGTEKNAPAGLPTVVAEGDKVTGLDFSKAAKEPSKKLEVVTLVEGEGPAIPDTPTYVTFNYFGEVYGGKKPFDESYSKEPVTFAVGNKSLIQGWDQGLVGVKEGSRVLMVVPPELGYGEQGSPPNIPPNATLVFVIDVLGVDA